MAAKGTKENPYTMDECIKMLDDGTWEGGYIQDEDGGEPFYMMKEATIHGYSGCSGSGDDNGSEDDFEFSTGSHEWHYPDSDTGSNIDEGGTQGQGNTGTGTNPGGNTGGGGNSGGGGGSNSGTSNPYPQTSKTISGTATGLKWVEGIGIRTTFSYNCGVRIDGYTMTISVSVNPYNFTDRQFWAYAYVKRDGGAEERVELGYNNGGYISEKGYTVLGTAIIGLPPSGNVTDYVRIGYDHDTGAGHTNDSEKVNIYPF